MKKMNKKWIVSCLVILLIGIGIIFNFTSDNSVEKELYENLSQINAVYVDSGLVEQTKEKIKEKEDQIGDPEIDQYLLQIGIAQMYELLGDGVNAYEHLLDATETLPQKSLAYRNLGILLVNAEVYEDGESYLRRAIEAETTIAQNHTALIDYYTRFKSGDEREIEQIFKNARESTNDNTNVLRLYAIWLEEKGDYIYALDIWKLILRNGGANTSVERRIESLTEKINSN